MHGVQCIRLVACTVEAIGALGLKAALEGESVDVVGLLSDPSRICPSLNDLNPDVLIWECDASANAASSDVVRTLRAAYPRFHLIAWIQAPTHTLAIQLLGLGVKAILPKSASLPTVRECVLDVAAGGTWLEPGLAAVIREMKQPHLSRRELQLVHLVAGGLANKEIAAELYITEGTVKVYLSKLFRKLNIESRLDLAMYGVRNFGLALADRSRTRSQALPPSVEAPRRALAASAG